MRKAEKALVKNMFDNIKGTSKRYECIDVDNEGRTFTLLDTNGNLMVVVPKQMIFVEASVATQSATVKV